MTESNEILSRMKARIEALEERDVEEFDAVALVLGLAADAASLAGSMCGKEKVEKWKADDAPVFYRFASKLKTALETQRDYVASVENALEIDVDAISVKIENLRKDLNALLDREETILKQGEEMFRMQDELIAKKRNFDALLKRKAELETARNALEGVDLEKLAEEVERKEEANKKLDEQYRPLLSRREAFDEDAGELRAAIDALSAEIARLETAYGPEAARLADSVPSWLEKIRARIAAREKKNAKLLEELAREAEELNRLESGIQDNLRRMNECREQALNLAEIDRLHFQANRRIGDRFSDSLADGMDEIEELTSKIHEDLERHDRLLKEMHARIEASRACVKPVGMA